MNCNEVKELFAEYWDLADNDVRRIQVKAHVKQCPSCSEEFKIWEESSYLIQDVSSPMNSAGLSSKVMNRIYADESWRQPVHDRIYSISYTLRRNLTAVISFCLALFIIAFLYSIIYEPTPAPIYSFEGLVPVASAIGDIAQSDIQRATLQSVPVASVSEPFILGMNPMKSYPDYMVVLSLLGVVIALLILNWFSRLKA